MGRVIGILVTILFLAGGGYLGWHYFLRIEVKVIDGLEFVRIRGGETFLAGSPSDEFGRNRENEAQKEVKIDRGFWISRREITNGDYKRITGNSTSENPNHPVTDVSWNDAKIFCKKFAEQNGDEELFEIVRLPTEWEWEYCARAGSEGAYGVWMNRQYRKAAKRLEEGDDNQLLRYGRRYMAFKDGERMGPAEVGIFRPNRFGLYDMNGNVWEWCENDEDFMTRPLRGGGWRSDPSLCRNAYRGREKPDRRTDTIGFRIVLVERVEEDANSDGEQDR